VEAAIRLLASKDAIIGHSDRSSLIHVRLLATPDRIKAELGEDAKTDLYLLRALWRRAGDRLYDGAIVDAADFPPAYGGARGVMGRLDGLQARQFVVWRYTEPGSRLARPDSPLEFFRIDWQANARRLAADLGKLDAIQKYAYSNRCRREFVLRYFGDPAAKPRCTGCDNCLGIQLSKRTVAKPKSRRRRS
jgi:ATP-dependent DNA helicase RecQ